MSSKSSYYPLAIEREDKNKIDFNPYTFKIYVTGNTFFTLKLPDITPDLLTLKKREDCLRLENKPLVFYQNQFTMAMWFATTGCGISFKDLNHELPLVRSVFRFHTYYQIGKIFKTLQIPLPGTTNFNEINNNINVRKYRELLSEFNLNDEYDFSIFNSNNGWSTWNVPDYDPNITDPGYYINDSKINFFLMQVYENKMPPMFKTDWDKGMSNFKYPDHFIKYHVERHKNVIEAIAQKPCQTYQQFMLLTSPGLSRAGVERLNDSIRTYVYCLLAAQAQARTAIIGKFGTQLDAQKQFKKLLEDSINKHADIPTSIARYQKSINDTHVRLNYVIGSGLYIIGSDMVLKMGSLENYNNNILIASSNMKQGRNDINTKSNKAPPLMEGNPVRTYKTKALTEMPVKTETPAPVKPPVKTETPVKVKDDENMKDHENMKFYLIAAMSGILGLGLYFYK